MAQMSKISVIIPTYNAAKYIREALDSVLAQTYPVHEIIVVDDGSTDNTRDIVKSYVRPKTEDQRPKTLHPTPLTLHHNSTTISYIYQENNGPASARNTGIRAATGEYIAFLDADDLWLPEKLEKQMKLFESNDYAFVYCDMSHAVENKVIHQSYLKDRGYKFFGSGNIYRNLLKENFIFTPTVIIQKEVFEKIGYFDETYKICEDYKMWLKIANKYQIGFVDEPLVIRRRVETNITADKFLYTQSWHRLFEELLKNNGFNSQINHVIRQQINKHSFDLGYHYWKHNDIPAARKSFTRALLYKGNIIKTMPYLAMSWMKSL
jgi:cellulose synthase/poly-beta-1,6-N-acetylglucosamine synthase-like glycosyltransferase